MELSTVIRLTTDPVQLEKLRNKLSEYQARHGDTPPAHNVRASYKMVYLAKLLEKGELNLMDEVRLAAEKPNFSAKVFQSAMRVINAYNSGDFAGIHGGSGLQA